MGSIILFAILHAKQNRVVLEYISIVLRRACWAPAVMLFRPSHQLKRFLKESVWHQPIRFIKDDDLMPTGRKGDLLLSECFDLISNDIDSSVP